MRFGLVICFAFLMPAIALTQNPMPEDISPSFDGVVSDGALPDMPVLTSKDWQEDGLISDSAGPELIYNESTHAARNSEDQCINFLSAFPNDDFTTRYQFFKLTTELAVDATPQFVDAMHAYGDASLHANTPVLGVIENIANPVLRQAAPEIIVASMDHLIGFGRTCRVYISGQIESLSAFDPTLSQGDSVITEDALFLRQVLADSFARLNVDADPVHGPTIAAYNHALLFSRNAMEYTEFEADIAALESLYMEDLDGRLARSNDMINSEFDRDILKDSVKLSDDMNDDLRKKHKDESVRTLFDILSRY